MVSPQCVAVAGYKNRAYDASHTLAELSGIGRSRGGSGSGASQTKQSVMPERAPPLPKATADIEPHTAGPRRGREALGGAWLGRAFSACVRSLDRSPQLSHSHSYFARC